VAVLFRENKKSPDFHLGISRRKGKIGGYHITFQGLFKYCKQQKSQHSSPNTNKNHFLSFFNLFKVAEGYSDSDKSTQLAQISTTDSTRNCTSFESRMIREAQGRN